MARGQAVGILLTLDQLSEPLVSDVLNDRLPSSEAESAIPVASEKYSAQTKKQSLTRGTNSQDIVIVQHRNEGGWIWLSHRRDFALTRIHARRGYVMRFRIEFYVVVVPESQRCDDRQQKTPSSLHLAIASFKALRWKVR